MLSNKSLFKRILLIFTAILLAQCTKVAESQLRVNQTLVSPYTMPAEAYLDLAKNKTGFERQSLEIMAAGRSVYDGQWQEGLRLLKSMESLPPELLAEKNILLAKIHLIRQQSKAAIAQLSSVHKLDNLPLYFQVQYHELLASAYRATGNRMDAINERIKLEEMLPDESARSNNRRALWLMLTTMPAEELNSFAVEATSGSVQDGWIQLAVISRSSPYNVQKTLNHLEQWKQRFPNHPGNTILPAPLAEIAPYLFSPPHKVALLLPVTGKLSGPGNAIRDGFMQAYETTNKSKNLVVQVYDTDTASASTLYKQAIEEGADYVVGPLGKNDVADVASMNHPVPTILLNDATHGAKQNAYLFGLSPVHEAMQAAVKARKNGHIRALIIAPANPWGDEVSSAFARQWQANGGQVVDAMRYSETENIGPAVKQLLHATEAARPKRGHPVVATGAHRRQDFDMIFLLAYPTKARQIMPMLKYYYAGNVPVYATSAVYSGSADTQKDRDLDGVIFCDMPWVFNHQMGTKHWPEQWNSYNRLYALGMDSFNLVTQLNQLLLFPATGFNDQSGVLYLTANRQINRILVWGKIQQGLAQEEKEG